MYYMDTGYKTVEVNHWLSVLVSPPAPGWCRYKIHWQDGYISNGIVSYGKKTKEIHRYSTAGTYAPRIEFLPNKNDPKPGVDCIF